MEIQHNPSGQEAESEENKGKVDNKQKDFDLASPSEQLTVEFSDTTLESINDQLAILSQLFQDKIREDSTKAELFEKMYRDLTYYREDFVFKYVLGAVFRDLIRLFDLLDQTLQKRTLENMQKSDLIKRLHKLRQQVYKIMEKQEVTIIKRDQANIFDETVQDALGVKPVNTPEKDGTVVEVLKRGFKYREQVLRPEQVIVGRFDAKEEDENG